MASGKSTVARLLATEGFTVIDADAVVAELYRPGRAGAGAIRALLGPEALTADGAVDHPAVAARVFAEPDLREQVEGAIHPLVRQRFAARAAEAAQRGKRIIIAEVPLLFEAGWQHDFDVVVTVEADPASQLRRAVARGLDETQARARLAAQTDNAVRRAGSDIVIENDGSLDDLGGKVRRLCQQLRERLSATSSGRNARSRRIWRPDAIIIAGANGAGKTTFARQFLHVCYPQATFLNADEIQREDVRYNHPVASGRELLRRLASLERRCEALAVETTLSSRMYAHRAARWTRQGYRTTLHFIELSSEEYAVQRVAQRVAAGGHAVSEEDIRRRFSRGLRLFETTYKPAVDQWYHWSSDDEGLRFVSTNRPVDHEQD